MPAAPPVRWSHSLANRPIGERATSSVASISEEWPRRDIHRCALGKRAHPKASRWGLELKSLDSREVAYLYRLKLAFLRARAKFGSHGKQDAQDDPEGIQTCFGICAERGQPKTRRTERSVCRLTSILGEHLSLCGGAGLEKFDLMYFHIV